MGDPESGRDVWLRRRVPELLVEVVLIVFAVLLALGVDECRQDRMRVRRAAEAHETILEEVTANFAEVEKTLHEHEALLVRLRSLRPASGDTLGSFGITYSFAELTDAAWEAAQVTQATSWMPFEWVSRAARTYERQELFEARQRAVMDQLAGAGAISREQELFVELLESQVSAVVSVERSLVEGYRELLAAEGRQAEEP
jgi:hypothetical protein